ncbi:MAG: Na+/H+ antiporter NhaA [Myxococcales bacterium]|nr:Na+/H+ antiporter NhaA [Myxococcales bacterium]
MSDPARPSSSPVQPGQRQSFRRRLQSSFLRFIRAEAASGVVLIISTVVALLVANSPWHAAFAKLWSLRMELRVHRFALSLPLQDWINDGLMAVFFLVVGLEIKRELLQGELASIRKAALPVVSALGGMLVPALIFLGFTHGTPLARGFGIPTATDIAFTVGVMALLGRRVPLGAKVFVTALAIADDLGAVVVIAVFYSSHTSLLGLLPVAGIVLSLTALNVLGVRRLLPYLVMGVFLWLAMHSAGVHATLAGVVLAMCIPISGRHDDKDFLIAAEHAVSMYGERADSEAEQDNLGERREASLRALAEVITGMKSPLHRLEQHLHTVVAFGILPLFALCNAGVELPVGQSLQTLVMQPVSLGVFFGLLCGKPIGIFVFGLIAIQLRLCEKPSRTSYRVLFGSAMLAGIGFTMSIFITGLAFSDAQRITEAKVGVLLGSLCAALLGSLWLRLCSPPSAQGT